MTSGCSKLFGKRGPNLDLSVGFVVFVVFLFVYMLV